MNTNASFPISNTTITRYKTQGYIKLKEVFNREELTVFEKKLDAIVLKEKINLPPPEERNTYSKAFIQLGNLWKQDLIVKSLVFLKRIAHIAQQLMEVDSVRLYYDQAVYKEASGGITPWLCDQQYWP